MCINLIIRAWINLKVLLFCSLYDPELSDGGREGGREVVREGGGGERMCYPFVLLVDNQRLLGSTVLK